AERRPAARDQHEDHPRIGPELELPLRAARTGSARLQIGELPQLRLRIGPERYEPELRYELEPVIHRAARRIADRLDGLFPQLAGARGGTRELLDAAREGAPALDPPAEALRGPVHQPLLGVGEVLDGAHQLLELPAPPAVVLVHAELGIGSEQLPLEL